MLPPYSDFVQYGAEQEREMPELQGDITYSIDGDETTFSANTPAGEKFLEGPELAVPNDEAKKYLEAARDAGLTVVTFP